MCSKIKKECAICGKEIYVENRSNRKNNFCSKICYGKSKQKKILKTCAYCGKEIYVQNKCSEKNSFCSRICFGKSRQKKILKICEYCGKEVSIGEYREKQFKYCSKKCYTEASKTEKNITRKRKIVICAICNKKFEIIRYQKNKFCSRECSDIFQRINKVGLYKEKFKTKLFEKKCKHCKQPFKVWNFRKDNAEFCSSNCYNQFRHYHGVCLTCGKQIDVPNYAKKIYCSQECFAKSTNKRKSGFSKSVFQFLKKITSDIEEEVCFISETYKYFADFILDKKVNIECDGTYWHCDPDIYNENYFNSKAKLFARDIWERDKKRDEILHKNHSLIILRLKEKNWKDNEKVFFDKLKENLNEILQNKINSSI